MPRQVTWAPMPAAAMAIRGPLPPSFSTMGTSSMLADLPAAEAMRPANSVMVSMRLYSWLFVRVATAWMISSTNPSKPTRNFLVRMTLLRAAMASAALMISLLSFTIPFRT